MKKCPFTYLPLAEGEDTYSAAGLKKLDRNLKSLSTFPYSRFDQIQEAQKLATKLSIQGVQPKVSAKLNVKKGLFEIVESGGTFIIKPQVEAYLNLPENEDLTMHLASLCGIQVPWHGLIMCSDGTYSYAIKRFDRLSKGGKVPLEDFAQLSGVSRQTKYDVPLEKCAEVIFEFCTYPTLELIKLFERTVFSFLVGNEDLHVKNLSLITKGGKISLSPAYDLLNSSIATPGATEELALSLNDKKSKFTREDFVQGFALKMEMMNEKTAQNTIDKILLKLRDRNNLIHSSFLPPEQKTKYENLISSRIKRLE